MGGAPASQALRQPARRADPTRLREVAGAARPVALAGDQLLPVLPTLAPLVPGGGLRRGTVVGIGGPGGATSLALAMAAGPSAAGSWVAAVGMPDLGVVAAADAGIVLERLALVPSVPSDQWAVVTAALLDALDVVLVRPPARVRPADARRLAARARERGSVLVPVGAAWPEATDVRLAVVTSRWHGLGDGHGVLQGREVEIAAGGRGAASRERRVRMWLPAPAGGVRAVEPSPVVDVATTAPARQAI